jgi:quercetin dioxygenase-like cupin family protein
MQPHSVQTLLRGLSRQPMKPLSAALRANAPFASTPFSKLESFNHGGIFVGRFSGTAPWERHRRGDELVHVLGGEVKLTVMTARGPVDWTLGAGSVFVVPRGLWHRQQARTEVTLLSATPTPTDVSFSDDPRAAKRPARTARKRAGSRRRRSAVGRSA